MPNFGLTAKGKRLFGWEKEIDGRRAHWMKVPLDWFTDPVVLGLNGSQRYLLLGLAMLCMRRTNLVPTSPKLLRLSLNLSRNPDLAPFMALGLIELDVTVPSSDPMRGEEREEIEERETTSAAVASVVPPPPPPKPPANGKQASLPGAVASRGRPSWLTPPSDLWHQRWGDESEAPMGEMQSAFSKPYADFKARGELDELWARWGRFLAAAVTSQWARPSRFVQGLGEWTEGGRPPTRAGPKQSVGEQAMAEAAKFLKAGKGGTT